MNININSNLPSGNSTNISFPAVHTEIPWSVPVEVTLIGTLGKGEGDSFLKSATKRQQAHPTFIDEYNEESAKIGNLDVEKDDPTAVYSFLVAKKDLVFHRHEGHRVIMGITGSSGAALKFSSCTAKEAHETPEKFLEKMFVVVVPGDSVFVLRFSGEVYHQFGPCDPQKNGFFAISVHTNELKGLSGEILDTVVAGDGSIPLLTDPIPPQVVELLAQPGALEKVPVYSLSQMQSSTETKLSIEEVIKPFINANKIPSQKVMVPDGSKNWSDWHKDFLLKKLSRVMASKKVNYGKSSDITSNLPLTQTKVSKS